MKFSFVLLVLEVSHLNKLERFLKLEVEWNEGGAYFKLCPCLGPLTQNTGGHWLKWMLEFWLVLRHAGAGI